MKRGFFLKLGIAIVVGFGLLLAGFYFWKPLNVTYYKYQIGSENIETHKTAVNYLLNADAIAPVKYYYENKYASKDVKVRLAVVDELCAFGDKGKELMRDIFRARCMSEQVLIPAGSFMMGTEKGKDDEKPVHNVTLNGFWMDKCEVTNEKFYVFVVAAGREFPPYWKDMQRELDALYAALEEAHAASNRKKPAHWSDVSFPEGYESHPITHVSWNEANEYSRWLKMRLPTEAEWEYACRAGSKTEYFFGDNADELENYAWFNYNSESIVHPVAQKLSNKWGLYDMHGNIWEYVQDWYDENCYMNSPKENPKGPYSGEKRILRGGGLVSTAKRSRSTARAWTGPEDQQYYQGFRVCRSAGE